LPAFSRAAARVKKAPAISVRRALVGSWARIHSYSPTAPSDVAALRLLLGREERALPLGLPLVVVLLDERLEHRERGRVRIGQREPDVGDPLLQASSATSR